jgi:hypothetical protein
MIEQVFEDYTELPSLDIIKNFITYYWNGSTSNLTKDGKCTRNSLLGINKTIQSTLAYYTGNGYTRASYPYSEHSCGEGVLQKANSGRADIQRNSNCQLEAGGVQIRT